jgi:hypothetical protein
VTNSNASCAALAGALVDIWHCDAEGNYSYGGTDMQATNYQSVHFLRPAGDQRRRTGHVREHLPRLVFGPGHPHPRAHLLGYRHFAEGDAIAFPEGSGMAVAAVNGYAKDLNGYTSYAQDNVFSDGVALELATVTGSTSAGLQLAWALAVPA